MHIAEQLNSALADRYVVDREIGSGGMAIVYRAHDLRHDRSVALKVLNPELGAVLGATRFLAEIRVTANLQHPNLLPLFDSGEANGLLFYVMPYVEGESLRSRLTREKQLPIDEAVHIAASVAGALEYAHAQGVIHRDLKPENVLLQSGQPVVADFGIALAVTRAGGARVTQSGISLGTPQYMSPEQATGDRVVDGRTDIYSLAAVLYEMLTGDPPHSGNTVQSIIAKVLTEDVPSVRLTRPNVPEHVAIAISRGLEKLPADRWSSAREFADALTGGRRVSAAEVPAFVPWRATSGVSRVRSVVRAALFAAVGVAAGIAVTLSLRAQQHVQSAWFDVTLPDSAAPIIDFQAQREAAPTSSMALSPDGSLMAYIGGPTKSVFVRALDQLVPRRLLGTDDAACPSFSPDSRWILFVVNDRINKIAVRGGPPIVLADSAGCGVWTDRNEIVFSHDGLFRVSADGGPVSLLARMDSSRHIGVMNPSHALPGGDAALICLSDNSTPRWQVGVVSLPSGRIARLTDGGYPRCPVRYANGHLLFIQNRAIVAAPFSLRTLRLTGSEIALLRDTMASFSTAGNGTLAYISAFPPSYSLVAASADGQTRTLAGNAEEARRQGSAPTALDTAYYAWPRLSPDGKRIALEVRNAGDAIWVYDIASRTLSRLNTNLRGLQPVGWTPDGRSVVYIQIDSGNVAGPRRVVSQPWDGSAPPRELIGFPERVTRSINSIFDVTIGPAHGYAAFVSNAFTDNADIWIAPLDTPGAARPLISTRAREIQPRLSPDGMLLAYVSDETGRYEVNIRSVLGPSKRLQVAAGWQPVWSRDGRQLYYRAGGHVFRATIARGAELRAVRRDTLFGDVFNHKDVANFDVFPGGKELLMIRTNPAQRARAAVVFNWPDLLHQRTAPR